MIVLKTILQVKKIIEDNKVKNFSIGFVPTMGALHEGHLSLIKECADQNDVCICSIFVNPAQFNNESDFEKYPVTIEKDIDMLERAGCAVLFLPSVSEMYPPHESIPHYELGDLENILEGKFRPGHFQGVCQIVDKLLAIVLPSTLYLGQKDYQQCMVIQKMIQLKGYNTELRILPTIREKDGLAMSSRNMRLNEAERKQASSISQALLFIKQTIKAGPLAELKKRETDKLISAGCKVDYIEIADATTLASVEEWDGKQKVVALIAAFLNEVRLIDNMLVND